MEVEAHSKYLLHILPNIVPKIVNIPIFGISLEKIIFEYYWFLDRDPLTSWVTLARVILAKVTPFNNSLYTLNFINLIVEYYRIILMIMHIEF